VGATALVLAAIALQIGSLLTPLPTFLKTVLSITNVVLIIHAVEGVIGAVLILLYKSRAQNGSTATTSTMLVSHLPESTPLAVVKAGLYTFFVGTVGLLEIVRETKATASRTEG